MIRQHRDDTLPFGSNSFCSFILLADNRIRVFPDNGFGIPYVEVEDNATPTHNFGYAHLGAGIDKLTLRTNDVVAMNYFDGTQVYVPSLGTDIHLTVDTGAGTYDEVILGDANSIREQAVVKTGAGNDIVSLQRGPEDDFVSAIVDFGYAQSLGLGNQLNVESVGVAQLDNAPGTSAHPMYVDQISMAGKQSTDRATLSVDHQTTIGDLNLLYYADATISAGSTISSAKSGEQRQQKSTPAQPSARSASAMAGSRGSAATAAPLQTC